MRVGDLGPYASWNFPHPHQEGVRCAVYLACWLAPLASMVACVRGCMCAWICACLLSLSEIGERANTTPYTYRNFPDKIIKPGSNSLPQSALSNTHPPDDPFPSYLSLIHI